jgi:Putative Zn-dependent protease
VFSAPDGWRQPAPPRSLSCSRAAAQRCSRSARRRARCPRRRGRPSNNHQPPAPTSREHERILAAYNGAYDDPKLEGLLNQTVAKLVAASERPDVNYRVTILNSDAINAFALPTGQLYVTRGLIALANDTSELASVLSHEMSHVIARHAAMREDQARQVALVSRVVQDVLSDPETGALALAKSRIALAELLARTGIRGRCDRGRHRSAGPATIPMARPVPHFAGPQRGAEVECEPIAHRPALARFPLVPSGHARTHQECAGQCAPDQRARRRRTRQGELSRRNRRSGLWRGSERRLRARPSLSAPKLGFTFLAPEGFSLDNTAQAVLGVKEGGGQALRLDVVRVPAEQTLAEYLNSGWIENIDPKTVEDASVNGLQAATATAKGDQWVFRLYAVRFGTDVYRFIFASKRTTAEIDRAFANRSGLSAV